MVLLNYKGTYDKTIYHDPATGYCIVNMKTADINIPEKARSKYTFRDNFIRFTATGYHLPLTGAVELSLEGEWNETKYGYQLAVSQWEEILHLTPSYMAKNSETANVTNARIVIALSVFTTERKFRSVGLQTRNCAV